MAGNPKSGFGMLEGMGKLDDQGLGHAPRGAVRVVGKRSRKLHILSKVVSTVLTGNEVEPDMSLHKIQSYTKHVAVQGPCYQSNILNFILRLPDDVTAITDIVLIPTQESS